MSTPETTMDRYGLTRRELDAEVARRVFHLKVEATSSRGEPDYVYRLNGGFVRVPSYGHSLTSSILLENHLREQGWTRLSSPYGEARAILQHQDGRRIEETGASMAEALCRAALRAVEMRAQVLHLREVVDR